MKINIGNDIPFPNLANNFRYADGTEPAAVFVIKEKETIISVSKALELFRHTSNGLCRDFASKDLLKPSNRVFEGVFKTKIEVKDKTWINTKNN